MKAVKTNGKKMWCGRKNGVTLHYHLTKLKAKTIYTEVFPIKQQEACLIDWSEISKPCKIAGVVISKQDFMNAYNAKKQTCIFI